MSAPMYHLRDGEPCGPVEWRGAAISRTNWKAGRLTVGRLRCRARCGARGLTEDELFTLEEYREGETPRERTGRADGVPGRSTGTADARQLTAEASR